MGTHIVFDPWWLDIDFPAEPDYVHGDNGDTPFGRAFGSAYEDNDDILDERQLREESERQQEEGGGEELVTRVYNQKREGSCVAQASCQANESIQAKTYGRANVVHLSAMSLYKQIGRSASSGATVSSGLRAMRDVGVLPLDSAENRAKYGAMVMENTGFKKAYPKNWHQTAERFQSVPGILTALARQLPVVVGRDGHSICYCRAIYDNGWKVLYANSWGDGWGFGLGSHAGGFGFDSTGKIRSSARWAYVIRSVRARNERL